MKRTIKIDVVEKDSILEEDTTKDVNELMDKYIRKELDAVSMNVVAELLSTDREWYNASAVTMSEADLNNILGSIVNPTLIDNITLDKEMLYGKGVSDIERSFRKSDKLKGKNISEENIQRAISAVYGALSENEDLQRFEETVEKEVNRQISNLSDLDDEINTVHPFYYTYDVPVRVCARIEVEASSKEEAVDKLNNVINEAASDCTLRYAITDLPCAIEDSDEADSIKIFLDRIDAVGPMNNYVLTDNTGEHTIKANMEYSQGAIDMCVENTGGFTINWDEE